MTMPEARTSVELRAWFWWFVRSLCGEGTLGSTERNVLGVLPVPVRSALLRAVQEIDPGALESLDVRRAGLHAEDGNYVWVHSWRFAGGDEPTVLRRTARRPSVALDLVGSFLEEFRAWQRAFLSLLRRATERGVRQLRVGVTGASLPVVELAFADALATVERASEFYGITVALPDIELLCASPRHVELAPFVSQVYRDHDGTVFVDLPRTLFACRVVDRLPGIGGVIAVVGGAMFVLVAVATVFVGQRTPRPAVGRIIPEVFSPYPAIAGGAGEPATTHRGFEVPGTLVISVAFLILFIFLYGFSWFELSRVPWKIG